MERIDILRELKRSVVRRFNLRHDQADEAEVIDSITRNSDFIGANLWTLIFAILIASIGLNMNSAAVIIGAMLISPLMGPIMGIGLGIGTNDFDLVKKGLRNLLIATVISIGTSAIYFWITPIHSAQSELLARTTPSVWDVFIAFFGGLAGVVAATRKEKSNAIPGVAIATALMPPLCTAGFGLATGQFYYFLGALYLYCINSIFICISTFLIIRLMKFKRKSFADSTYGRKVSRYILITTLITIIPSVYLTYGIVNKSLFENASRKFVEEQFRFKNTQVISKTFRYDKETPEIDLLLIGYELPVQTIDSIRNTMKKYDLQDAKLLIRQGLNAEREIDFSQIKASILKDVFARDSLIDNQSQLNGKFPNIYAELKALYPAIISYSANSAVQFNTNSTDTLTQVVADFPKSLKLAERLQLERWLKNRLQVDTLKLIIE
ncbi:MAG: TIGR00341 family protein [Candidatus Fluviicola riflensis]|nr:MAG: TIGR00341 family protein [Candidatus Fluviicola riflensis]OGS78770.1 MAG: TIGR00341 family protein [Candidatus Fluviicola riflensis]OGS86201.1 MAG: TIGR00341 family protein [Fluviicola sp. RIFCSPHIGHO2_01_FULL_43_53]OGS87732.1 MAG: TIGR00341 family protein [Fluviicola sp. RIFCSPHIGHO2_12_FULL_43_24]